MSLHEKTIVDYFLRFLLGRSTKNYVVRKQSAFLIRSKLKNLKFSTKLSLLVSFTKSISWIVLINISDSTPRWTMMFALFPEKLPRCWTSILGYYKFNLFSVDLQLNLKKIILLALSRNNCFSVFLYIPKYQNIIPGILFICFFEITSLDKNNGDATIRTKPNNANTSSFLDNNFIWFPYRIYFFYDV